jgi:hypothetical protein
LREPPRRPGDRKLAIEREKFTVESMNSKRFEEEAFGLGRVDIWDEGEVEVRFASLRFMTLIFSGSKISGEYQLRRMRWYPGNRWLLKKMRDRGIL